MVGQRHLSVPRPPFQLSAVDLSSQPVGCVSALALVLRLLVYDLGQHGVLVPRGCHHLPVREQSWCRHLRREAWRQHLSSRSRTQISQVLQPGVVSLLPVLPVATDLSQHLHPVLAPVDKVGMASEQSFLQRQLFAWPRLTAAVQDNFLVRMRGMDVMEMVACVSFNT